MQIRIRIPDDLAVWKPQEMIPHRSSHEQNRHLSTSTTQKNFEFEHLTFTKLRCRGGASCTAVASSLCAGPLAQPTRQSSPHFHAKKTLPPEKYIQPHRPTMSRNVHSHNDRPCQKIEPIDPHRHRPAALQRKYSQDDGESRWYYTERVQMLPKKRRNQLLTMKRRNGHKSSHNLIVCFPLTTKSTLTRNYGIQKLTLEQDKIRNNNPMF